MSDGSKSSTDNVPRTLYDLNAMRKAGKPIAMLTCYDFPTARLLAQAGVHILLVGDSAAMTVLGHDSTATATLDYMCLITQAVRRGAPGSFVLADMPAGTYEASEPAIAAASRLRAAGADAVKLEVDRSQVHIIESLAGAGFVLCAHLGLLPQRAAAQGGYRAHGRTRTEAVEIIETAVAMRRAGAAMLLLEAVPDAVSQAVISQVDCVVLGCGAGKSCHGHVLVWHDLLGFTAKPAKFVETFADVPPLMLQAAKRYVAAVMHRQYPAAKHEYSMKEPLPESWPKLMANKPER